MSTTQGVPAKRRNITVACEACRQKKLKCDGLRPKCSRCQDLDPCTYRPLEQARQSTHRHFQFRNSQIERRGRHAFRATDATRSDGRPSHILPSNDPPQDSPYLAASDPGSPNASNLSPASLRIPFFRYFGPTAIASGIKTVLFDTNGSTRHATNPDSLEREATLGSSQPENDDVFAADCLTPRTDVSTPLLHIFFAHFHCHFPFFSKLSFMNATQAGTASALLLNAMCALAARFSRHPMLHQESAALRGEVFANKAKSMLVPLLNIPSHDVVASLLMVAWHELANNHDAGLYMYTGMACRMALDLGMDKNVTVSAGTLEERRVSVCLFRAIELLENIVSFATGRPSGFRMEHTTTPHLDDALEAENYTGRLSPLANAMRIVGYLERIGNISHIASSDESTPAYTLQLITYSKDLMDYYNEMHASLLFTVQNYRLCVEQGNGPTFLLLHLWFNAVVITLHRPNIRVKAGNRTKDEYLDTGSRELTLSAARTISSIVSLAESTSPMSLLSCPFADQAIAMAGLVFSAELNNTISSASHSECLSHHQNYQACLQGLKSISHYWKGVGWVIATMQNSYSGVEGSSIVDASVLVTVDPTLLDANMLEKLLGRVNARPRSDDTVSIVSSQNLPCMVPRQFDIALGVTGMTSVTTRQDLPGLAIDDTSRSFDQMPAFGLDPNYNVETFSAEALLGHSDDLDGARMWQ